MWGRRDSRVALLRGLPLFQGCTNDELSLIGRLADQVQVGRDRVLIEEGREWARECFVILEGRVQVTRGDETLAVLGPGSIVGEMSLLDGLPRGATVTTKTAVSLLALTPPTFAALIDQVPGVARKIMRIYGERLRAAGAAAVTSR